MPATDRSEEIRLVEADYNRLQLEIDRVSLMGGCSCPTGQTVSELTEEARNLASKLQQLKYPR